MRKYTLFWAVWLFIGYSQSQPQAMGQKYYTRGFIPISSGGFTFDQPFLGGFNSPQFQNMDLNNDGVDDLLTYDRNDDKILPFLRVNDSFYHYAPQYEAYFPAGSFYYITADINSDGKWDIFTLDASSSLIIHKNITKPGDSFPSFLNLGQQYYRNQYVSPFPILYNGFALSRTDLPSIVDADGDGDLDIITYDATYTIYVMYSDVRSDFSWDKDTFEFQKMDVCFGYFNDFNNTINLGICPYQDKFKPRHTGGASLLVYDNDADGDMEMVISNIGVKPLYLLKNGKSDYNLKYDSMVKWDSIFPPNTKRGAGYIFPSAYLFDVDGDGAKDLITAPNAFSDVKETDQIWYYKNFGQSNKPNFQYVRSNFLTDKNIDLGAKSSPAFLDVDADGDMDLFVGSNGDFEVTGGYKDRIYFYENTGTHLKPQFELRNSDWLNISKEKLSDIVIKFGDVDGDKDMDLLIGNRFGYVRWYENTAGALKQAAFQLKDTNLLQSNMVSGESNAAPVVFNYNNDTLPDMLVGFYDGTVHLYVNTGTTGNPSYTRAPGNAWGMHANQWYRNENDSGFLFYGNAVPEIVDLDNDGIEEVLLGTAFGSPRLYHINGRSVYDSLLADNSWIWQRSLTDSIVPDFGSLITPAAVDLDGDSIPEILFGNSRGGLLLVTSTASKTGTVANQRIQKNITFGVYPNPAGDNAVLTREITNAEWSIHMYDMGGRMVQKDKFFRGENAINVNLSQLKDGMYFIEIQSQDSKAVQKLLVRHD